MDCQHAMAPSDEELLNFALDEEKLSETEAAHLEQCETCQRRLKRYLEANTFLVSQLYRSQCPSGTELSYYCIGGLAAGDRIRIANHLLDCPLCAAEVADTRQFLNVPDRELLPSFSFSPRAAMRRVFGTLVKQQGQLVMRGEATESAWPRQYHAGSIDLSLHITRASSGNYMLLGILTSAVPAENVDAFEGIDVELYTAPGSLALDGENRAEAPLLRTQVDDLGNIVFNGVPAGNYLMLIHLPDSEVFIDALTIDQS